MVYPQKKYNIITDNRASAVLYRFLINRKDKGKIVVPVNICPVVVEVILKAGYSVLYVDISEENFCLDIDKTIEMLKSDKMIKGVLINHTYGVEYDFSVSIEVFKSCNVFIVEDKCLCQPVLEFNHNVDLTLFSTGYAKIVDLNYAGGIGLSKSENSFDVNPHELLLDKDKSIRINDFNVDFDRYMSDIKTGLELSSLQKNKINQIYSNELSDISLDNRFNNWRYNIVVIDKERIVKEIFKNNLFVSSHYKPLSDNYPDFNVSWSLYDKVINLFNDKYFDVNKAQRLVEIIRRLNKEYDPFQQTLPHR